MKYSLIVFSIFLFTSIKANNYYFSTSDGDDSRTVLQSQNPATPWKTLNKLNSFNNLKPGDSVLFKRGDSFYGNITVNNSGGLGKPIIYSAYGIGEKPIITGFTTISGWTNFGKNIYYASLNIITLNAVTVDGVIKKMGRYPNSGYLHYQSHTNNTSVTSNDLTGNPDWTGAEIVIRKYRWILDRHKVTAQKGGTLTYNALADYGNNNSYEPVDGNGFFLQGNINTLDTSGEWFYDKTNKRLYMYFGEGTPSSKMVEASSIDKIIVLNSRKYISFNNIVIQGSNILGVEMQGVSNIAFNDCDFKEQGGTAIYANGATNLTINGGIIKDALNNGIWVEQNGSFCSIDGVTISNIGTIAGAGKSGDASQEGISISGDNTSVKNCNISNTGYSAINFNGNNALIENNFVDSFCTVKDDGGGIYTYLGVPETKFNRIIRNNIVLNAIGAFAGVESYDYESFGKAAGIYLDGYSNHVEIIGNTIAHGNWGGIFINNNNNSQIRNNIVYDFSEQISFTSIGNISNTIVSGNEFVAKTSSQKTLAFNFYSNDNPGLSGSFDNNIYARPISESSSILLYRWYSGGGGPSNISLAIWKSVYNQDLNSTTSPKIITDLNDLRFEYNGSLFPKDVNLGANYIDITGKEYNGKVVIAPYSSAVLIKNGPIINQPPSANAGAAQTITLPVNYVNLSGSGTDADGTVVSYLWTKISGPSSGTFTNLNATATSVTGLIQGTYQFELQVTDNGGAVGKDTLQVTVNPALNIPPVAKAGTDQTITLPVNYVNLSGSASDADGTVVSFLWTKISGPSAGSITNMNAAATSIAGLVQGTYQFELKVTDNSGAFGKDTMSVTVNPALNIPPIAKAGSAQTITLPLNFVSLAGSGTDADGTVVSYLWTKISGPVAFSIVNAVSPVTDVSGLVQGTYKFELKATDNSGGFGKDTVTVTVNPAANIPPIAKAGADQTITLPVNSVSLPGSGTDADGTVVAYLWTKVSGPATGTITNMNAAATSVTGLIQGAYQFELEVTDNKGAVGKDTMKVIVYLAANIPPLAKAGGAQMITLPINALNLSGSGTDVDGTIVSYLWNKISGPATGTITNMNAAATSVTGLIHGIYQFELKVTDNSGALGKDTMQVIVNPAVNIPPLASAGSNISITLPRNKTTLAGSGTDADGTVISFLWTKILGPTAFSIVNAAAAVTDVSGLDQGTYQFELKVTDNSGATTKDTMQVIVNPAVNIPPLANAGSNKTITIPTNKITLAGSGTDADGAVISYLWNKISGPASFSMVNPASPITDVTGLVQGIYQFELKVTDNNGAVGKDTMQVIVNKANIPPLANAGPDITVTLPVNSVNLNGSGTDADGLVVSYLWKQISGPAGSVINQSNTAVVNISNLVGGNYELELAVTDNEGATGKDTMILSVALGRTAPLENRIQVYQNPVKEIAMLEINTINPNGSNLSIIMSDMIGKVIYRQIKNVNESTFTEKINMASVAKGIYTLTIFFNKNEKQTLKIVKL